MSTPNNSGGAGGGKQQEPLPMIYNPQGSPYPAFVRAEGQRGATLYEECYKSLTEGGPKMTPDLAHFVIEQHWPEMVAALKRPGNAWAPGASTASEPKE